MNKDICSVLVRHAVPGKVSTGTTTALTGSVRGLLNTGTTPMTDCFYKILLFLFHEEIET